MAINTCNLWVWLWNQLHCILNPCDLWADHSLTVFLTRGGSLHSLELCSCMQGIREMRAGQLIPPGPCVPGEGPGRGWTTGEEFRFCLTKPTIRFNEPTSPPGLSSRLSSPYLMPKKLTSQRDICNLYIGSTWIPRICIRKCYQFLENAKNLTIWQIFNFDIITIALTVGSICFVNF